MDKIQGKIKFIAPSLQDEHYSTADIQSICFGADHDSSG